LRKLDGAIPMVRQLLPMTAIQSSVLVRICSGTEEAREEEKEMSSKRFEISKLYEGPADETADW
jgi:hypothetical protein